MSTDILLSISSSFRMNGNLLIAMGVIINHFQHTIVIHHYESFVAQSSSYLTLSTPSLMYFSVHNKQHNSNSHFINLSWRHNFHVSFQLYLSVKLKLSSFNNEWKKSSSSSYQVQHRKTRDLFDKLLYDKNGRRKMINCLRICEFNFYTQFQLQLPLKNGKYLHPST